MTATNFPIQLTHLRMQYGQRTIFNTPNLTIPQGKYLLSGKNGTGKSTLLKLICRLEKPTSGSIATPETVDLVAEYVHFPAEMSVPGIFALYDNYERCNIQTRNELIESFQFSPYINMKVSALSQGNHQKLRLILALSGNGAWLLLDEPFNGLDADSVGKLNQYITNLTRPLIVVDHSNQSNASSFSTLHIRDQQLCIEP